MYKLSEETVGEVTKAVGALLGTYKEGSSVPLQITGYSDEQMVTFMVNNKGSYQLTAMIPLGQEIPEFEHVVDAEKFNAKLSAFQALKGAVVVDEVEGTIVLSKEDGMDLTDMPLLTAEVAEFTPDITKCIGNFTCEAETFVKEMQCMKMSFPRNPSPTSDNVVLRLEGELLRMLVLSDQSSLNTLRTCDIKKGQSKLNIPTENDEMLTIDLDAQATEYLKVKGDEYITIAISKVAAELITRVYTGYSGLIEVSVFPTTLIFSLAGILLQIPLVTCFKDGFDLFYKQLLPQRSLCIGVDGVQLRSKCDFLVNNFKLANMNEKKEIDQRLCLAKRGDEINISVVGNGGEHAASILAVKSKGKEPDGFITVRASQLVTALAIYGPSIVLSFEPGNAVLYVTSGEAGDDKRGTLDKVSLLLGFRE